MATHWGRSSFFLLLAASFLRRESDLLSRAVTRGQFTTEWARTTVYSSSPLAGILFIVTAIVFLRWIYVVAKNAGAVGAQNPQLFEHSHELTFTPGWCVGWYFVPIFNLWRPYQAMKWIWKASGNPADPVRKKNNYILRLWWTFWLISNLLSLSALSAAQSARKPSDYSTAITDTMVANAFDILLCIFAILLVRRVSRRQLRTATDLIALQEGHDVLAKAFTPRET